MNFNKKNFIKRLKEIRLAKKLTQENVADKVGLETSNYCKIERGNSTPLLPNLYKIVKALDISFDELIDYDHFNDEKFIDEANLKIYNNFTLKQKQCIYKILRAIEDFK